MNRKTLFLAVVLSGLGIGCETTPRSSLDAPGVQVVADNRVLIDSVVVQLDQGSLDITGKVHRTTGSADVLTGRIDIEFVAPTGEVLDGLPVPILPHELSTAAPSAFHVLYGYVPPKGSTLRLHFVDGAVEACEDLEGGFFDAGENGGGGVGGAAAGGGPHNAKAGGHAANHYSNGHTMGFGSNFGSNNFAPGGRR